MPKVKIYTKSWCPFCAQAKDLLDSKGVRFEEFDVEHAPERTREMLTRSNRRTVPQIFIDGRHIGGSDDLLRVNRDGRLDQLLRGEPPFAA